MMSGEVVLVLCTARTVTSLYTLVHDMVPHVRATAELIEYSIILCPVFAPCSAPC